MISITPSHIIEYLYCPRYTYFEYVLAIPQNEEKYYRVEKGRNIHERKSEENTEYLRKRLGVVKKDINVYLTNGYLRGEVDEVLELNDGKLAPLDYKFAEYKDIIYQTYRLQLHCYSILIEENYGKKVEKGFLVYTRSKNKLVEVEIEEETKKTVKKSIEEIYKIVEKNFYPKATKYKKKCYICTYKNVCTQ